MALALPPTLADVTTGATDPIRYYRRPGIGWIFRRRIEMGLEMLPQGRVGERVLEVGYGAGVVLYNLGPRFSELHGVDLDADPKPAEERLSQLGIQAHLVRGSVLEMENIYVDEFFDAVVCFSVMEHLRQPELALAEMHRVLKLGGLLLIGMPAVNRFMEYAFHAIGFKGIEDHHVTTPAAVWRLTDSQRQTWRARRRQLPRGVPFGSALYHTFCLQKV